MPGIKCQNNSYREKITEVDQYDHVLAQCEHHFSIDVE